MITKQFNQKIFSQKLLLLKYFKRACRSDSLSHAVASLRAENRLSLLLVKKKYQVSLLTLFFSITLRDIQTCKRQQQTWKCWALIGLILNPLRSETAKRFSLCEILSITTTIRNNIKHIIMLYIYLLWKKLDYSTAATTTKLHTKRHRSLSKSTNWTESWTKRSRYIQYTDVHTLFFCDCFPFFDSIKFHSTHIQYEKIIVSVKVVSGRWIVLNNNKRLSENN